MANTPDPNVATKVGTKEEYQKNLDSAFEEVVQDLEATREVLKEKLDEIAASIKAELNSSKKS